ncbi:MAG: methionyl-tRNA formyltransferase [Firmicutes bacterium]|nr:methionyl-tRNA formyltransferase [Bacillota bacterium]
MRIVFMGTPDFAVPALRALADSRHEVTLVVTQPDKPKGRSGKLSMSAVKSCAVSTGIPVFQPARVKKTDAVERIRLEQPDVIVVAAYGQILSGELLNIPRYGCLNIHGSLLPKYRGAAPVQWAVINGEEKSGLTIMQMDKGLDTGDILLQEETVLQPEETAGSLYDRLSAMGGPLILKTLDLLEEGTLTRRPQPAEGSSYAKMLRKEDGLIDFEKPASETCRLVRGLNPWPSAYTYYEGRMLKIWRASAVASSSGAAPGTVSAVTKDEIRIACGDGELALHEIQMEGKKRMQVHDFLLGTHVREGEMLGTARQV